MESLRLQLRTDSAVEPVTLTDMKLYLRVTGSSEDSLITSLIVASRDYCEKYLSRTLITKEWSMWLDRYPTKDDNDWWDGVKEGAYVDSYATCIFLPKNPVQSVDVINYYDYDDVLHVWSTTNYSVDIYSEKARVCLRIGGVPPTSLRLTNGIEIQFTSGYGNASTDVPNGIINAIKMVVAYMYQNRGCDCTQAMSDSGANSILSMYRVRGMN